MKKVLSVLLAAAMVAGMSVSSFAADRDWTWTGPKGETPYSAGDVVIDNHVYVDVDDDNYDEEGYYYLEEITALNPGDVLYFPLYTPEHKHTEECKVLKDEAKCEKHTKYAHEDYEFNAKKGYFVDEEGKESTCHELVCELKLDKEHHPKHTAECYGIKAKCTCKQTTVTDHTDDCYELGCGMRENGPYFGKIDKDWALKTKTDKYVDSVAFACINPANGKFTTDSTKMGNGSQKFIKVVLVEDIDTSADVEFDFEI